MSLFPRKKPVFGRGARRKRRLERRVPPRGAGPFWPGPWRSANERDAVLRLFAPGLLLLSGALAFYALDRKGP